MDQLILMMFFKCIHANNRICKQLITNNDKRSPNYQITNNERRTTIILSFTHSKLTLREIVDNCNWYSRSLRMFNIIFLIVAYC
ncbi:hypothetical protein D3C87_529270 [compost metagenome]